ncbi:oxidoreductase [Saccharospirillum sp. MSK14-1]|uniref:Gfo/Idh/MocA family oxidoreductase n=1 Tax=Saccharospirillum sp. MSK14-1 TaxID=1897632 RepID=UPI000D3D70DD|nr:Gfo/Idh/MocA family oxidoreductase [Saccharospirillum sp. MSK14-1]PTY36227.1 oxidoreductase [Saccharospirillum sp. MSK14-1]
MTQGPIRSGLIGYGLSGRVFHAPFIDALDAFSLDAVASRQADTVQARYPDCQVVAGAKDLIANDHLDLIVITAPNDQHYPLAKAALDAGKHVLLEKPAVTQLTQMEDLAARAERAGRILCVYQNRRFDGDFLHLKTLRSEAPLGQLKHLESRFDRFRPQPQSRWREQPGDGSGIFWDLGPHLIDQALHLLGAPEALTANLRTLRTGSQTTDWFELQLHYADCEVVLGSTPYEAGAMRRFNARFEGGGWQCWGLDPQEEALRADQAPTDPAYPNLGAPQNGELATLDGLQHATPTPGDYRHFYQHLAQAITGQGAAPVSLDDACALLYTLERAEESARLGQRLDWTYQRPTHS